MGQSSDNSESFQNMDLVAAERLHSEPLLQIKATSHRKRGGARPDGCESTEAVYAVYPSVICFLPGFSLFQTLRSCRSQVPYTSIPVVIY